MLAFSVYATRFQRIMVEYSRDWPEEFSMLDIELACYRHRVTPAQGGLGPVQHFVNACELIWPEGSKTHIDWHPWALSMITKAIDLQEAPKTANSLGVAGAASAGKSFIFGAYGIINWLCDPENTTVLTTSTTLKESRKRIWGVIGKMFANAEVALPGRQVESQGAIRTVIPGQKPNDMSGIHLIAGEKKKEKAAIDKLIGIKNKRVFLIADELTSLSPAVVEATSNLQNNEFFQMVGLGNANSVFDPHGMLCEPLHGWQSVKIELVDSWQTKFGWCLRFDAERSPNYVSGETLYPFMPTRELVDAARVKYGAKSRAYYRMYRSIWFSDDEDAGVFSDADLVNSRGDGNIRWLEPPHPVAGLDLGYSNHGDRTILVHGLCGVDISNTPRVLVKGFFQLSDDATQKDVPRNFQIARQVRDICTSLGIRPQHLAFDGTGSGGVFGDVISHEWEQGVLSITFGGWASDRMVRHNLKTVPANEVYANRSSEMWGEARHVISNGQIVGVFPELAQELTTRKFIDKHRGDSVLLSIEDKPSLRKRTGKSCDIADAFLVMVDLCRVRIKFRAVKSRRQTAVSPETTELLKAAGVVVPSAPQSAQAFRSPKDSWRRLQRRTDVDALSGNFLVDENLSSVSVW